MHENYSTRCCKRIAILSPSAPPLADGGIASHHWSLAKGLTARGYKVKLYTFAETSKTEKLNQLSEDPDVVFRVWLPLIWVKLCRLICYMSFGLYDLGRSSIIYQTSDILKCLWSTPTISKHLKAFSPDLVILPDQGVPHLFLKRLPGAKYIQICHHNPLRFISIPFLGKTSVTDAKFAAKLEQIALKNIDAVICPSNYMKSFFKKSFQFRGPVEVIPNLLDYELIQNVKMKSIRSAMALSSEAPLIHIPSAGSSVKGSALVPDLIEKISKAYKDEIGFYLSGDVSALQSYLKTPPSNVKLYTPGRLTNEDHLAILKNCNICVSPTLVENFSIALSEAKALNQQVISFDVGGNSDVVNDSKYGELVQYLDVEALTAASIKALKQVSKPEKRPVPMQNQTEVIDHYVRFIEEAYLG